MIVLAIVATILALPLSIVVVLANAMSDSPSTPFRGTFILIGIWALVGVFWLAWWFR